MGPSGEHAGMVSASPRRSVFSARQLIPDRHSFRTDPTYQDVSTRAATGMGSTHTIVRTGRKCATRAGGHKWLRWTVPLIKNGGGTM